MKWAERGASLISVWPFFKVLSSMASSLL
uniref:Uncharacterized protein n=1 Tax=Arundo donax TaxID=35708 RepID=A0A0A9C5J9_ARUDO